VLLLVNDSMTSRTSFDGLLPAFSMVGDQTSQRLILLAAGLLVFVFATRLISGLSSQYKKNANGVNTVPMAPYWVPLIGHIPHMLIFSESFFAWTRKVYDKGIFSVNLVGTTHNIIYKPGLSSVFMNLKTDIADAEHVSKQIMLSNFGFPKAETNKYDNALHDTLACYKHLMSNPGLSDMVTKTINAVSANINNLVSFSKSAIDQPLWERSGSTRLVKNQNGEEVVEASLLPLLKDFIAFTANGALVGSDFMHNYSGYWQELWTMDKAFMYLATGLPRWFPLPVLTRGHIALRNMMRAMTSLEVALQKQENGEDPGSDWANLEDVSAVVKNRQDIYRRYGFSMKARASFEVALVWAMNANANPAVFWLLNHIYADKELLEDLRKEVASYVHIAQPKHEFPIPEMPRLEDVDLEGLEQNCPLLKSSYIETLRLDVAPWSFKIVNQDFLLSSREKDAEKFWVEKGTFAHIAHELHNKDPAYWDHPMIWRADRHIKWEPSETKPGEKVAKADMGTIRSYGKSSLAEQALRN